MMKIWEKKIYFQAIITHSFKIQQIRFPKNMFSTRVYVICIPLFQGWIQGPRLKKKNYYPKRKTNNNINKLKYIHIAISWVGKLNGYAQCSTLWARRVPGKMTFKHVHAELYISRKARLKFECFSFIDYVIIIHWQQCLLSGAPKCVPLDSEKHLRVHTSSHKCHSHVWRVDTATGKTLKKQNAC